MPNVVTKIYSLGKEVLFIMKKRKFSKVIAVALAALMVVGMVPMMAFAADTTQTHDVSDATNYSTSIKYEDGDDLAYLNFQYEGVSEDGTMTVEAGDPISIGMVSGGYDATGKNTDSLGWYTNLVAESHYSDNASNDYAYIPTGEGHYCISTDQAVTAVAVNESGQEYSFNVTGNMATGVSSEQNQITDASAENKMENTIAFDGFDEAGTYTLSVTYKVQFKHYDYGWLIAWENSSWHDAGGGITATDEITINVTAPETPDDEKTLADGITKTVTGSKVAFSGGSTGISEFNPALDLCIYDSDDLKFTYEDAVLSVDDTVKASFNYTDIPESIMEYEDLEFGITDITSSYSPETEITAEMVIPLIAGLADDEEVIGLLEGLSLTIDEIIENVEKALPITVDSSNGIAGKMAVEFTAVATDKEDETKTYDLEVVETADGYSISASGLPVGTYDVTVGYTLTFGFDYDFSTSIEVGSMSLGPISIPVSASVKTSGSEDSSRTITDSDTFTITVYPCTHPEESVSHTDYAEQSCADGNNEYWYCALCGRYFLDENLTQEADYETEIVIPGDGSHVWSDEEGASTDYVAPNCTDDGAYATKTCAICGEKYRFDEDGNQVGGNEAATDENIVIPALGHTEVVDEAVEPTCGATGLTEGSHCEVCGEIIVAQEVVPATGEHSYVAEVTKEAEIGIEGEMTYTCEVCGDTYTEPIPALEPETETEELPSGVTKSIENTDVTYTIDGDYDIDIVANVFGFDISLSDIPTTQNGSIVLSYTGLGDIASGATLTFVPEFDTSAFALTAVVELEALGEWASMVEAFYSDWPYVVDEGSIDGYSVEANWISATATNVETGAVTPIDIVVGEDGVATFSVAGLEDGEYEITVDYDLSIITDLNLLGLIQASVETMSIPNCSDTFTITVGGEAAAPSQGEDEPCEHDFYIVDSQAGTCMEEGWVLYACSICGEQWTTTTGFGAHNYVDGVCTVCGAIDPDYVAPTDDTDTDTDDVDTDDDSFTESDETEEAEDEEEDEFTEVEEDEFDVVSNESTTSPQTGASLAAVGAAMAFAAAGIVVVTRKKKEED